MRPANFSLRRTDGLPAPWSAEETDACCIVRDANRQALAYVYFEGELDHRSAAHLDEARRIAANIAKLPELLRGPPPIKRGVTRLQPHISRQSAQCPLRPQVRKYRRNALSDVMGQNRSWSALFDDLVGNLLEMQ